MLILISMSLFVISAGLFIVSFNLIGVGSITLFFKGLGLRCLL